jgi:hypothetical protein
VTLIFPVLGWSKIIYRKITISAPGNGTVNCPISGAFLSLKIVPNPDRDTGLQVIGSLSPERSSSRQMLPMKPLSEVTVDGAIFSAAGVF